MRKYYNLQLIKTISVIGLKTVEKLILDKNFSYPLETHVFYEFVYVLNGSIVCLVNNEETELDTGKFRLILPNIQHRYYTKNNAEIFIVCFKCKASVLSALDQPISLNEYEKSLIEKLVSEAETSFEFPFKERVILKKDAPIGAEQITENVIEELLITLLRKQHKDNIIGFVKNETELRKSIVNNIVELLKNGIYDKLSLDDICKKTFYSNTYLNNLFKKYKRTTIMHYYNLLKIEESKKLLKSGLSVSDTAEKLRYDSPNYFTKSFKKITGITPLEYKKNN